ncbi:Ca2+-binding RTX toxin-like protein [Sinorhizobium fredii]|nr:endo-1,3-1,4-beta-glycanase [Sinorhizobium fredii CCBAU 83666]GEC35592.1 hypothetical protein EFR01_57630 [Sinorhizobium fredii]GLS07189.1 hypothetical protein GCM10007864_08150 [Sinorhizobium fredii]
MSRTVINAVGEPLCYSGNSTAWFSAAGSGPKLYGSAGNDSIYGDSSVNVTMIGGKGDDIIISIRGPIRPMKQPTKASIR